VALKDDYEGVWHCPERIPATVYKESRGIEVRRLARLSWQPHNRFFPLYSIP
jgi:hypothetical protein